MVLTRKASFVLRVQSRVETNNGLQYTEYDIHVVYTTHILLCAAREAMTVPAFALNTCEISDEDLPTGGEQNLVHRAHAIFPIQSLKTIPLV